MATRIITIDVCDRCVPGREKEAAAVRHFAIEDRLYELRLCEQHAEMFDRDMGVWTQLAQEADNYPGLTVRKPVASRFTAEAAERARRAAALRVRQQEHHSPAVSAPPDALPAPTAVGTVTPLGTLKPVEPGERWANGWLITPHAAEKALERGYTDEEILTVATRHEVEVPSLKNSTVTERFRGDHGIVVNPTTKVVITVIPKKDVLARLDEITHPERIAQ